jgi:hypothetical protein
MTCNVQDAICSTQPKVEGNNLVRDRAPSSRRSSPTC